jgi:hypothetical protein
MKAGHLNPEKAISLLKLDHLPAEHLQHVIECASCNGWLRAFAALASVNGDKIKFASPRPPISN